MLSTASSGGGGGTANCSRAASFTELDLKFTFLGLDAIPLCAVKSAEILSVAGGNGANGDGLGVNSSVNAEKFAPYKICGFFEPTSWMKDRNDYSLFVFAPENR